jgi:hypothetical protein
MHAVLTFAFIFMLNFYLLPFAFYLLKGEC